MLWVSLFGSESPCETRRTPTPPRCSYTPAVGDVWLPLGGWQLLMGSWRLMIGGKAGDWQLMVVCWQLYVGSQQTFKPKAKTPPVAARCTPHQALPARSRVEPEGAKNSREKFPAGPFYRVRSELFKKAWKSLAPHTSASGDKGTYSKAECQFPAVTSIVPSAWLTLGAPLMHHMATLELPNLAMNHNLPNEAAPLTLQIVKVPDSTLSE